MKFCSQNASKFMYLSCWIKFLIYMSVNFFYIIFKFLFGSDNIFYTDCKYQEIKGLKLYIFITIKSFVNPPKLPKFLQN